MHQTDTMQCIDAHPGFKWFGNIGYYMHEAGLSYSAGLAQCRTLNAEYPTMLDDANWKSFKDYINHREMIILAQTTYNKNQLTMFH